MKLKNITDHKIAVFHDSDISIILKPGEEIEWTRRIIPEGFEVVREEIERENPKE